MKRWIQRIFSIIVTVVIFLAIGYYIGHSSSYSMYKSAYEDATLSQLNLEVGSLIHVRGTAGVPSKAFVAIENLTVGNILILATLNPNVRKLTDRQIMWLCNIEAYVSRYGFSNQANNQTKVIALAYLKSIAQSARRRYQPSWIKPEQIPYMTLSQVNNIPKKVDIGTGCGHWKD